MDSSSFLIEKLFCKFVCPSLSHSLIDSNVLFVFLVSSIRTFLSSLKSSFHINRELLFCRLSLYISVRQFVWSFVCLYVYLSVSFLIRQRPRSYGQFILVTLGIPQKSNFFSGPYPPPPLSGRAT